MKHVVSQSEVAHLWANKIQSDARNAGSNFYFNGDTIYSYGSHFPIATHFIKDEKNIVLFTVRGYSNTTAKHISKVRSAASHLKKVYCYAPVDSARGIHSGTLDYYLSELKGNLDKLTRARKPESYISSIESLITDLREYTDLFKLKLTGELKTIVNGFVADREKLLQVHGEAIKKEADKKKREIEKRKKAYLEAITQWENYSIEQWEENNEDKARLARKYPSPFTNLRTDGTQVETSKGIKIPVAVAKTFYKWYLTASCKGDCKMTILDYEVTSANEKELIVRCHHIQRESIDRIAAKLGWNKDVFITEQIQTSLKS